MLRLVTSLISCASMSLQPRHGWQRSSQQRLGRWRTDYFPGSASSSHRDDIIIGIVVPSPAHPETTIANPNGGKTQTPLAPHVRKRRPAVPNGLFLCFARRRTQQRHAIEPCFRPSSSRSPATSTHPRHDPNPEPDSTERMGSCPRRPPSSTTTNAVSTTPAATSSCLSPRAYFWVR